MPDIKDAGRIIILDAVQFDGQPGSVYRLPHRHCQSAPCIGSLHGIDLFRVLAQAGRGDLPEVQVFGIEPAHLDWSLELSPQVSQALPILIREVIEEIDAQ